MRKLFSLALVLSCAGLLASAPSASAQTVAIIDYLGFAWEDGGIPNSMPGDVLAFTAVATQLDPIFGIDLQTEEVTILVTGLISTGEFDTGFFTLIGFTAGHIEIYSDSSNDHDWAVFPPNAQQATFTNGTLILEGDFTSFSLALNSDVSGSFEGVIDGVGGTMANTCVDCAFTFGGAFGRDIAQTPDGYDLQLDGILEIDTTVAVEPQSFGNVKALYSN